jgi:hypothetical protein
MPDYTAKTSGYKTIQNDMWDIISLREYGDEHAMNWLQDHNFDLRFIDAFAASVLVVIPQKVNVQYNLKSGVPLPSLDQLLPWR